MNKLRNEGNKNQSREKGKYTDKICMLCFAKHTSPIVSSCWLTWSAARGGGRPVVNEAHVGDEGRQPQLVSRSKQRLGINTFDK